MAWLTYVETLFSDSDPEQYDSEVGKEEPEI